VRATNTAGGISKLLSIDIASKHMNIGQEFSFSIYHSILGKSMFCDGHTTHDLRLTCK